MLHVVVTLSTLLFCLVGPSGVAGQTTQYPDLPVSGGRTANLVEYPAGSWVIDMGSRQTTPVNNLFNLYAYGLVVRLLSGIDDDVSTMVPVDWAIKSNKASKSEADFTASVRKIHPIDEASNTPQSLDFEAGPFIVHQQHTAKALAVLNHWKEEPNARITNYAVDGLSGSFYEPITLIDDLVIYELASAKTIDIRHQIRIKPAIFLSGMETEEPSTGHQEGILIASGLVKDVHYELGESVEELETLFNADTCHTVFTEPHYNWNLEGPDGSGRAEEAPGYKAALEAFVTSGGNFFAQCASVSSYENSGWGNQYEWPGNGNDAGAFMTKHGVRPYGNSGNEWGGRTNQVSMYYPYPDLPVSQFIGDVSGVETGTVSEFILFRPPGSSLTEAQLWKNRGHGVVGNLPMGNELYATQAGAGTYDIVPAFADYAPAPSGFRAWVIAGAKVGNMETGGMVYYSGSHSWFRAINAADSASTPSRKAESAALYNGRRVFMNVMLLPATRPANCGLNLCPTGEECPSAPLLGPCQQCICENDVEVITDVNSAQCCRDDSHCPSDTECLDWSCDTDTGGCKSEPKEVAPCPDHKSYDYDICGCACPEDSACEGNFEQDSETCECTCPEAEVSAECSEIQLFNATTCECFCPIYNLTSSSGEYGSELQEVSTSLSEDVIYYAYVSPEFCEEQGLEYQTEICGCMTAPPRTSDGDKDDTGAIVGGVIGALVAALAVGAGAAAAGAYFLKKKPKAPGVDAVGQNALDNTTTQQSALYEQPANAMDNPFFGGEGV